MWVDDRRPSSHPVGGVAVGYQAPDRRPNRRTASIGTGVEIVRYIQLEDLVADARDIETGPEGTRAQLGRGIDGGQNAIEPFIAMLGKKVAKASKIRRRSSTLAAIPL